MSRNRIVIIVVAIVAILLICVCVSVGAYTLWNTPLAPGLSYPTEIFTPIAEILPSAPTAEMPAAAPTATPAPSSLVSNCGNSGSMNILILGVDAPYGGIIGPLVINILKVDFSKKSVNAFSFPRDLWVPITGLESLGFTQARLGESYMIARSNGGFTVPAATNLVAQNLYKNFGGMSHHYITVKIATLAKLIDTVGGITVNIRVTYDGTPYGYHYFAAGPYYMNGALALEYALAPSAAAQWGGMDRKTEVFMALYQKLFSAEVVPQIPTLITQFLQTVTTDLSLQQVTDLVCISQQTPSSQITSTGVGSGDVTSGASGILYPNFDAIRAKVKQYLN
jgi:anionic cell wall polymer biosynthesis LytR-Cps2A-Psr (LCP) family protein